MPNDYYPFGSILRTSKTNEENHYRYGYQGQFAEEDEETGWNSFELRQYDPVIGRWISPDPYGQYWSPYLAMGNNPINQIDPDGGFSGGGDPPVVQSIGHQSLVGEFNFDMAMENVAPNLFYGISSNTMMLSDVLVEGSRMSWVRKVWFDLTESKTRGGIEYYSTTGNNAGAIYYVADGHASYGIDNPGDALMVFDKFGRPRSGKGLGLKPRPSNTASRAKGAAENFKFGIDALKKTKTDALLKPKVKATNWLHHTNFGDSIQYNSGLGKYRHTRDTSVTFESDSANHYYAPKN